MSQEWVESSQGAVIPENRTMPEVVAGNTAQATERGPVTTFAQIIS